MHGSGHSLLLSFQEKTPGIAVFATIEAERLAPCKHCSSSHSGAADASRGSFADRMLTNNEQALTGRLSGGVVVGER
jgi:hypothetical protein